MKVDVSLAATSISEVPDAAQRIEAQGYDGVLTFESSHDPFFPLLLAGHYTERIELTTAVAIAFARTPMTLANIAYDLQLASKGRFNLGLGTQIKTHIEKRYGMPWSKPAARMRELVQAIRAIFACWQDGEPLNFRGEFYTHTLMTPFANPGPNPYGLPNILMAGVGPLMTEVAGEVGDGFMIHPFSTRKFIEETTLPALERGLARSDRTLADFEISWPIMTIVADNEKQLRAGYDALRTRLAFYGSTPAYKVVLDAHGWGGIQPELNARSKQGDWIGMGELITDDIVDAFCISGTADEVAAEIKKTYGGLVQRISFDVPDRNPERVATLLNALHSD